MYADHVFPLSLSYLAFCAVMTRFACLLTFGCSAMGSRSFTSSPQTTDATLQT